MIKISFTILLFVGIIKLCINDKTNENIVKEVSGYLILQLEDGHWYLQDDNGSLSHYIECPKCNTKQREEEE